MREDRARDPEIMARFLREAEITARLEHPGIVPIYGLGRDEAGNPCYAMRFIQGTTLHQAIKAYYAERRPDHRRGPLETDRAFPHCSNASRLPVPRWRTPTVGGSCTAI